MIEIKKKDKKTTPNPTKHSDSKKEHKALWSFKSVWP